VRAIELHAAELRITRARADRPGLLGTRVTRPESDTIALRLAPVGP
jgi:hypothetical protein